LPCSSILLAIYCWLNSDCCVTSFYVRYFCFFLQEDGDIEAVGASEEDIVDELPANDVDSKQADVLMSGDNLRQA